MDKNKQKALVQWLKQQSRFGKNWLYLTVGFAFLSGLFLLIQAGLLAHILHELIVEHAPKDKLASSFLGLAIVVCLRGLCSWGKERAGYRIGEAVRVTMRQLIIEKLTLIGPAGIQGKPAGIWASLLLEQVEEIQDFFARYLPQMAIALILPLIILIAVFPLNWAAGLIFLLTAPLVPFFMMLVGLGAAEANRKNFKALQRLSGHFYDRLRCLTTIKLFDRTQTESEHLSLVSHDFRKRTMEVLRLAFLSSAVLEFFTALSIALTAVYFGFSFLGELNFGHYGVDISLFIGVFILVLAPEFYQPLRELGTFYHAKAQAVGAAESIIEFLDAPLENGRQGTSHIPAIPFQLKAESLEILSPDGKTVLAGPLNFSIQTGQKIALVGASGAGKTSLMNAILGFLPYKGQLKINEVELRDANSAQWHKKISWVGQNPQLFHGTVKENICLAAETASDEIMLNASHAAHAHEFIQVFPKGYTHTIGDRMSGLSVGQAQRIAVARALVQDGDFWLLDEPTASLDANSERLVSNSLTLAIENKTALIITHRLDQLSECDHIIVMSDGKIVQQGKFDEIKHAGELAQMIQSIDRSDLDA